MGENREMTLWIFACLRTILGSTPAPVWLTGAKASAKTPAPRLTKKEKNIHTAKEARAEVAVLRKATEKRIEIPNQKEI